ncbi:hypothetical protein [Planotetraspora mira]|uniref:hypothetical protein n=1 Tax=Planotetraspora mira TaxID=58121 RepID=UPI0027E53907|nr:hypothetical protein [Planotetraspora mira]
MVTLDEQDRGAWDAALIAEGHRLVRGRLASGVAPGRYQILAAINAVHTSARDMRDTDWSQPPTGTELRRLISRGPANRPRRGSR